MTKLDFMTELESLLQDISSEERNEALQYYNDYFDDAGPEHEEEVIAELGSPKRVASLIKSHLASNAKERESNGRFTEKGYQDTLYQDEKFEIIRTPHPGRDTKYNSDSRHTRDSSIAETTLTGSDHDREQRRIKNTRLALIILLCFVAIPVGLPLIGTIISITAGCFVAILSLLFGLCIAGVVLIGGGVTLFILGLIKIAIPITGLSFCGVGLIMLGLGMLLSMASIKLCKKTLPVIFRGFINLCRIPFRNRSVTT